MLASVKKFVAAAIAWALSLRVVRAVLLYTERKGPALADGITYRALFSIFAAVLLGFSLAATWLIDNPEAWNALVSAVDSVIPGLLGADGQGVVSPSSLDDGLRTAGIFGLIGLILASIGAIGSLRAALRTIAGTIFDKSFVLWVMLRNLGVAVGIALAVGISAALTYFGTAGVSLVTDWLGVSSSSWVADLLTRAVGVLVVFVFDAAVIVAVFLTLSGVKPPAKPLWAGAVLGAVGLTVLQQLSSLFVQGATSNPLLATFGSLVALLLWINLSAQVILIASTYIIVASEEYGGVVRRHAPATFAQRRLRRAEVRARRASAELVSAHVAVIDEDAPISDEDDPQPLAVLRGGPLTGQAFPINHLGADTLVVPSDAGDALYARETDPAAAPVPEHRVEYVFVRTTRQESADD